MTRVSNYHFNSPIGAICSRHVPDCRPRNVLSSAIVLVTNLDGAARGLYAFAVRQIPLSPPTYDGSSLQLSKAVFVTRLTTQGD